LLCTLVRIAFFGGRFFAGVGAFHSVNVQECRSDVQTVRMPGIIQIFQISGELSWRIAHMMRIGQLTRQAMVLFAYTALTELKDSQSCVVRLFLLCRRSSAV
jgi:hypothetical protein